MKTKKMRLAKIQGKLSRAEMKNIMAGSGGSGTICNCNSNDNCSGTKPTCYNGIAYKCTNTKGNNYAGVCDA